MASTETLWHIIILAMTPIVESRGSIPYGVANGIDLPLTLMLSFLGNMAPVPLLLLTMESIEKWIMSRGEFSLIRRIFIKYVKNLRARASISVKKYGFIGLAVFVAIPIPGTGAWTGSVVAHLFGIDFRRAILAILVGVMIAIFIITVTVLWISSIF